MSGTKWSNWKKKFSCSFCPSNLQNKTWRGTSEKHSALGQITWFLKTLCISSLQSEKLEKIFLFMTLARDNTHKKIDLSLLLQLVWASNWTASSLVKLISIVKFLMDVVKKCLSVFSKVWDNDKKTCMLVVKRWTRKQFNWA